MSIPQIPPSGPTPPSGFAAAILMLLGIVLLLPGLCSLFSAAIMLSTTGPMLFTNDPTALWFVALWILCGLISWGGIAMIRAANRRFAGRAPRESSR